MNDVEQDTITALVPVGETLPDDLSRLPTFDWRGIQYALWDISDWLDLMAPEIKAYLREMDQLARMVQNRRRNNAKCRARIVTRVKGTRRYE